MSHKIAVVGEKDSIMPFKMIGFDIHPARSAPQARAIIKQLADSNYGIIFITEELAQQMMETIAYYREKVVPSVILIPNYKGSFNIGLQNIQENVEKAIGTNIL